MNVNARVDKALGLIHRFVGAAANFYHLAPVTDFLHSDSACQYIDKRSAWHATQWNAWF